MTNVQWTLELTCSGHSDTASMKLQRSGQSSLHCAYSVQVCCNAVPRRPLLCNILPHAAGSVKERGTERLSEVNVAFGVQMNRLDTLR